MKWLTAGGTLAALVVGGGITIGLGWRGVLLLLAFFVSGSVLTRVSGGEGGQRNARQVLANGGVAAAAGLMGWWVVAAGALAAATADTWATEIGAFSARPPRLITTWVSVARGVSGGITLLGTAAGTLGAGVIGMLASVLAPAPLAGLGIVVVLAGTGGMIVDSVLGAALQGEFECSACGARFERSRTVCHEPVRRTRGFSWLDNDGVNLAATAAGALIAAAAWVWFSPP